MNHPALIFRRLSTAYRQDPAAEAIERLAADFAARVAAAPPFACVALLPADGLQHVRALEQVLHPYAVDLYRQARKCDHHVFIYARISHTLPAHGAALAGATPEFERKAA